MRDRVDPGLVDHAAVDPENSQIVSNCHQSSYDNVILDMAHGDSGHDVTVRLHVLFTCVAGSLQVRVCGCVLSFGESQM